MLLKNYRFLTAAAAAFAGLLITSGSAHAQVVVTDAVPTSEINPFAVTAVALSNGVTVTGSEVMSFSWADDMTTSPWNGNLYAYRKIASGTVGSLTYSAGGGYFTDFAAQIITNRGATGDSVTNSVARYTFEKFDGSSWSTFNVVGTSAAGNGGDYNRYYVNTTDLDTLTDITHLRVTMSTTDGWWEQTIGSVSMTVVPVPEPSSFALLCFGLTWVMLRRRRSSRS